MTAQEKLEKIQEMTTKDMDKHIHSSMELIKKTIDIMPAEEALKQIEIMIRNTAELSRSYAVLNAVTIKL